MQTAFLIDGFNFYHSLEGLDKRLRWFDYAAYCQHFMSGGDSLHSVSYFTALAYWRKESVARHRVFIEACTARGINVVLGKFKKKEAPCPHCKAQIIRHEEKATDVNIALSAYQLAAQHAVEQIILVTGDTDLIPAIRMIKADFPSVRVGVVFPRRRANEELACEAHFTHSTRENILYGFQLPDRVKKANGKNLTRPEAWK